MPMSAAAAFLASSRECIVDLVGDARGAYDHRCVNTSLSGTLFFLIRWCIREVVHIDSRVHAAK
jgi:hypothetical protein